MWRGIFLVVTLFFSASVISASSDSEQLSITTTEWPPYTSADLPSGGVTAALLRKVFELAKINSTITTVPWKRAIALASNQDTVNGYFPGYHCKHAEGFIPSDPLGTGPLGFAQRTDNKFVWSTLDDVAALKLKIGTVLGYANTTEFDKLVEEGTLKVTPAKNDLTNVRKLQRGRLDAVVIDQLTLAYLLASEPSLKSARDSLEFNETPLEDKLLYLCLNDTDENKLLLERFNQALATVDKEEFVKQYFESEF